MFFVDLRGAAVTPVEACSPAATQTDMSHVVP